MRDGTVIKTLADARKWALAQPENGRNEYQWLAGKLMAASAGGSMDDAWLATGNAAFLNMKLDSAKTRL